MVFLGRAAVAVVERFLDDLAAVVEETREAGGVAVTGSAPMYGMAASFPARTAVEELMLRWREGEVSEAEQKEIATILETPEGRKAFYEHFRTSSDIRETLRALGAEADQSGARVAGARRSPARMRARRPRSLAWRFAALPLAAAAAGCAWP